MTGRKINKKAKWIWLSVLVLLIGVGASIAALASVMQFFLPNDSGAIPLIPKAAAASGGGASSNGSGKEENDRQSAGEREPSSSATAPQTTPFPNDAGFEVSDDHTVWTVDTPVEIFRVSYVNGEQMITVNGDNGKKVIAPGTENSYIFKLKNTGNVALDYTVSVDAYFTPDDIAIPITGRIRRYDGQWIAGDKNAYVGINELDRAEDKATLSAGRYSYYTLDWLWLYESGNDELDTSLGNMAVEEDLICTIVIKTSATANTTPGAGGGIRVPQTGDSSNIQLWLTLFLVSFLALIILAFPVRRKNNTQ